MISFSFSAAVYELLKKKSRLFSFGGNNAFLEFFLEGVPGITQTHVNSKKVRYMCIPTRCVHTCICCMYMYMNMYSPHTLEIHFLLSVPCQFDIAAHNMSKLNCTPNVSSFTLYIQITIVHFQITHTNQVKAKQYSKRYWHTKSLSVLSDKKNFEIKRVSPRMYFMSIHMPHSQVWVQFSLHYHTVFTCNLPQSSLCVWLKHK